MSCTLNNIVRGMIIAVSGIFPSAASPCCGILQDIHDADMDDAVGIVAGTNNALTSFCDINAAIDYCNTVPLSGPEGIWIYPEDNVTVLIARRLSDSGNVVAPQYDIIVVETPDCLLKPGSVIGRLSATPGKDVFRLSLFTRSKAHTLIAPARCTATLADDATSMIVRSPSIKFSFNPLSILPRFWRIARIKFNDPLRDAPRGMRKIYPTPDNTGPHFPRTLYF